MEWEYKVTTLYVTQQKGPIKEDEAAMNELGKEGWELVAVSPHRETGGWTYEKTLIWKRGRG